ncbi:MAG: hypothetical protein H2169_15120 [Opitutus sp.]|nr:hypothetical protein [Opitutus sp.]
MSFKTIWRALLPLLGVWLLSATAANAMFLSADPIGTRDDPNLYVYVGLDPVNRFDPTGEESWLVSRPIGIADSDHMFVVVADAPGAPIQARFSYGPDRSGFDFAARGGNLVALTGTQSPTNRDDLAAWGALSDPAAAAKAGISMVQINASDATVISVGNQVNANLGTPAAPGPVRYAPVTNPMTRSNTANSNSAAYAVANTATKADNPSAPAQSLPAGARAPGWGQHGHVPTDDPDRRRQR